MERREGIHEFFAHDFELEEQSVPVTGRFGTGAARGVGGQLFDGSALSTPLAR